MLADRIEAKWIDAFCEIFERCAVKPGDTAAILSETQSRALNVHLAELALLRMGAKPFHIVVPTPRNREVVPVRSTGASDRDPEARARRQRIAAGGLRCRLHHRGADARGGDAGDSQSRRAHSGHLERTSGGARAHGAGYGAGNARARRRVKMLRGSKRMRVTSKAGTELDVDMAGASTVGVWGWTDRPGTLAHWPGGIVVSFPKSKTVNGTVGDGIAAISISPSSAI